MMTGFRKPPRSILRKLKLPEKTIRVLILIMIFVQTCSCNNEPCFGSVWKTQIYNENRGYVGVKGKQLFANDTIKNIYKISTFNASFYLFDETTRKFLCWKKSMDSMIAWNYKTLTERNHWHLCRFMDGPSTTKPGSHVHLHLAGHPEVRMQFDPKGRYLPSKRIDKCIEKKKIGGRIHPRHAKNCLGQSNFMVIGEKDSCREVYRLLCKNKSHIKDMKELSKRCKNKRAITRCNSNS